MSSTRKIFLSYSHSDEWLKDELIAHLAPLRQSNGVYVWHDRKITPGEILDSEISDEVETSDFFIFLLSSDFLNSDYCVNVEYKRAREREKAGETKIIPVVVRKCEWMTFGLNDYAALPTDGRAVADETMDKEEKHKRDAAWVQVAKGLKAALSVRNKAEKVPEISQDFVLKSKSVEFARHPDTDHIDEDELLVEPEIYDEDHQRFIVSFDALAFRIFESEATLIVGGGRSGKTSIAKQLFRLAPKHKELAVLISGSQIKNVDIAALIRREARQQYQSTDNWIGDLNIIIDDFEECTLGDRQKSDIISKIHSLCKSCVIISISSSASIIYAAPSLPNIVELTIQDLTKPKLMQLVDNWAGLSKPIGSIEHSKLSTERYDLVSRVFSDTNLPVRPYTAITFLELAETASAQDIQVTSFASCYDALITHRLLKKGIPTQQIDESKNFISFVAYALFNDGAGSAIGTSKTLEDASEHFEKQYFSDKTFLTEQIAPLFITRRNGDIFFDEPYLWYFLVARHIAGPIRRTERAIYEELVARFAENVHLKVYANILIYVAYFANDETVLEDLCIQTEEFFSKASRWTISDDRRSLMLNIQSIDRLNTSSEHASVLEKRMEAVKANVSDILDEAEESVSCYTTPGLGFQVPDDPMPVVPDGSSLTVSRDSYQKHVNALIRLHSVMGHILQARSGTYTASRVVETIDAMVRASGRYADLNQSVALLIQHGDEDAIAEIGTLDITGGSSFEAKQERLIRLFGFWSVYMSQAGLARYLTGEHTVRALKQMALEREIHAENAEKAFNFSSCYIVASLLSNNQFDEEFVDLAIKKFGEHSALMAFVRAAVFNQSHYLALSARDRQRIENKLHFRSKKLLKS